MKPLLLFHRRYIIIIRYYIMQCCCCWMAVGVCVFTRFALGGWFMSDDRARHIKPPLPRTIIYISKVSNEWISSNIIRNLLHHLFSFFLSISALHIIHTFDDDGVHTYSSLEGKNLEDKWPTMREVYPSWIIQMWLLPGLLLI